MKIDNFEFYFKEQDGREYCFANGQVGSGETRQAAILDWAARHAETRERVAELTAGPFLGQLRAHYCERLGISPHELACAEHHDGALFNGTAGHG